VTTLWNVPVTRLDRPDAAAVGEWGEITKAQWAAQALWFANLNTPQDFAEAEAHIEALDT
jgi:hypothetical protein